MSMVGMGAGPKGRQLSEQQKRDLALDALRSVTPQLILWGGDEVVTKWSRYKRNAGGLEPIDTMWALEELLLAIRRDFGHGNKGVERGDLLGLFVNDIDDHLNPSGQGGQSGSRK